MTPSDVADFMRQVGVQWAIAGGWAIDLWLDRQTRDHHDVEVVVPRKDQHRIREALTEDWKLFCLDPPRTPWRAWTGHTIDPPSFQLQVRSELPAFDVFLEDIDDGLWHYRREPTIRRPERELVVFSRSTIPVVRPEVQLLYMATSHDPKNRSDFEHAAPRLDAAAQTWLHDALISAHPGHPWIDQLT